MTPLETLQKYGLKTDVKSIRERVEKSYTELDNMVSAEWVKRIEINRADLSVLCSLAEKGERWEKAGKEIVRNIAHIGTHITAIGVPIQATDEYEMDFRSIRTAIAEAEGEGK